MTLIGPFFTGFDPITVNPFSIYGENTIKFKKDGMGNETGDTGSGKDVSEVDRDPSTFVSYLGSGT